MWYGKRISITKRQLFDFPESKKLTEANHGVQPQVLREKASAAKASSLSPVYMRHALCCRNTIPVMQGHGLRLFFVSSCVYAEAAQGSRSQSFWCWKGFGYLNTDWKRLEIPATLRRFGCSESPLAWSSSPLDPSLIKCVVLQRDAASHGGMWGMAAKADTVFLSASAPSP